MVIEISFPRGGRKPPPNHMQNVAKGNFNLFKEKRFGPKDTFDKPGKSKRDDNELNSNLVVKSADVISQRTLQDGLVILGCIREVKKMFLDVFLPGRLCGRVLISNISEPYTKLLESIIGDNSTQDYISLGNFFQAGQYIVVKIMPRGNNSDKQFIELSTSPNDINSELSVNSLTTGMILWCAVKSVEDHGYVIDLGLQNCRVFLPNTNVDGDRTYSVGELLWCVIQKCEISANIATITMNAAKNKIDTSIVMKDISLDYLRPGMQVEFVIEEILGNGLQGRFLNNFVGFVNDTYLKNNFDKPNNYKVGQKVIARILYITSITKFTYFTLKSFNCLDTDILEEGTISTSQNKQLQSVSNLFLAYMYL